MVRGHPHYVFNLVKLIEFDPERQPIIDCDFNFGHVTPSQSSADYDKSDFRNPNREAKPCVNNLVDMGWHCVIGPDAKLFFPT